MRLTIARSRNGALLRSSGTFAPPLAVCQSLMNDTMPGRDGDATSFTVRLSSQRFSQRRTKCSGVMPVTGVFAISVTACRNDQTPRVSPVLVQTFHVRVVSLMTCGSLISSDPG